MSGHYFARGHGISTVSAVCLSSVYKVKVESVTSELITDVYSMKIETVIKEGGSLFITQLFKDLVLPLCGNYLKEEFSHCGS